MTTRDHLGVCSVKRCICRNLGDTFDLNEPSHADLQRKRQSSMQLAIEKPRSSATGECRLRDNNRHKRGIWAREENENCGIESYCTVLYNSKLRSPQLCQITGCLIPVSYHQGGNSGPWRGFEPRWDESSVIFISTNRVVATCACSFSIILLTCHSQ